MARRTHLIIISKNERTCRIIKFAVPADIRVNLKDSNKRDKYPDLASELRKLWNMKVTVIPFVVSALGTITKGLIMGQGDLEITGQVETLQTTALSISA